MLISFSQINGAVPLLDPQRKSPATDIICVAFIFVYVIGFSLGFGPTAWVYNTEVPLDDALFRFLRQSLMST